MRTWGRSDTSASSHGTSFCRISPRSGHVWQGQAAVHGVRAGPSEKGLRHSPSGRLPDVRRGPWSAPINAERGCGPAAAGRRSVHRSAGLCRGLARSGTARPLSMDAAPAGAGCRWGLAGWGRASAQPGGGLAGRVMARAGVPDVDGVWPDQAEASAQPGPIRPGLGTTWRGPCQTRDDPCRPVPDVDRAWLDQAEPWHSPAGPCRTRDGPCRMSTESGRIGPGLA